MSRTAGILLVAGILLLLLGPAAAYAFGEPRFGPPSFALGAALAALSAAESLLGARRRVEIDPLVWPCALLLAGAAIPALRGPGAVDAPYFLDRLGTLAQSLVAIVALTAALRRAPLHRVADALPAVLAAAAALHFGYAAFDSFHAGRERMAGWFGNPNIFASTTAACLLPLARTWMSRPGRRPAGIALLAACFAIVLLAGSRAVLAVLVLLGVLATLRHQGRGRIAAGAAIAVVAALALFTDNPLSARLHGPDVNRSYSRPFIWKVAATTAVEHPLGVGLGMNRYFFARKALDPGEPSLIYRRFDIGIAHNVFLGTAVEAGLLGLLGLIGIGVWLAIERVRAPSERKERPAVDGPYLGALLLVMHAQVDAVAQSPLALAALAVLIGAQRAHLLGPPHRVEVARGRFAAAKALVAGFAVGILVYPTWLSFRAGQALRTAARVAQGGDFEAACAAYQRARQVVWSNPGASSGLVDLLRSKLRDQKDVKDEHLLLELERECHELARANRQDARPWVILGDERRAFHFATQRVDDQLLVGALFAYGKALELDPLDLRTRMVRARLLIELRDLPGATADLEDIVELEDAHAAAWLSLAEIAEREGKRALAIERYREVLVALDRAHEKLSSGRYGELKLLIEFTVGVDALACQRRLVELATH